MDYASRAARFLARPPAYQWKAIIGRLERAAYRAYCGANGYDFDGFIPSEALEGDATTRSNATAYQPYPISEMRRLVFDALRLVPSARTFVDVGCGKGKQCFYAAKYFNFDQVIGVDFSPSLVEIARRNLRRLPNARVDLADAATWTLPDTPCVVFMYNPFEASVMQAFIETNRTHFASQGSIVAYGNDRLRDVIIACGLEMLGRSDERSNSLFA